MTIKVTLHELRNAGPLQHEIAAKAAELLQQALNDGRLPGRIRAARFTTWHQDDAGHREHVSVDEVLEIIETGRELRTGKDCEIDLRVRLARLRRWWRRRKQVVGRTSIGGPVITTAYWFINDCIRDEDPAELAAHWMHEWLHVAGFYHHGGNRARGDVAYVIGDIVYDLLGDIRNDDMR